MICPIEKSYQMRYLLTDSNLEIYKDVVFFRTIAFMLYTPVHQLAIVYFLCLQTHSESLLRTSAC